MENKWWRITRYGIVGVALVAGIYDFVAYTFGGYQATISQRFLSAVEISPIIPLALGIVVGHVCWPQRLWSDPKKGA